MASIRSKGNTTTERAFLSILRQAGISGWRDILIFRGSRILSFDPSGLPYSLTAAFGMAVHDAIARPKTTVPTGRKNS
jgi:hypothetical protein